MILVRHWIIPAYVRKSNANHYQKSRWCIKRRFIVCTWHRYQPFRIWGNTKSVWIVFLFASQMYNKNDLNAWSKQYLLNCLFNCKFWITTTFLICFICHVLWPRTWYRRASIEEDWTTIVFLIVSDSDNLSLAVSKWIRILFESRNDLKTKNYFIRLLFIIRLFYNTAQNSCVVKRNTKLRKTTMFKFFDWFLFV